jgi:hypothetical protein
MSTSVEVCVHCGQEFETKAGLASHQRNSHAQTLADEKGKLGHTERALPDPILRIRRSELIRTDNYGVHGSDFHICRLCDRESGAGVLNKGISHESGCPLGRYEARVAKRNRTDENGVKP